MLNFENFLDELYEISQTYSRNYVKETKELVLRLCRTDFNKRDINNSLKKMIRIINQKSREFGIDVTKNEEIKNRDIYFRYLASLNDDDVLRYDLDEMDENLEIKILKTNWQTIKLPKYLEKFGIGKGEDWLQLKSRFENEGKDIRVVNFDYKLMLEENYSVIESVGTLSSACLRECHEEVFDVYKNQEMIIIFDEGGNVEARAILWKEFTSRNLKEPVKFCERIYGTDVNIEIIKKFCKKNGFAHKVKQSFSCDYFTYKDKEYSHEITDQVNLFTEQEFRYYPYLDTFSTRYGTESYLMPLSNFFDEHSYNNKQEKMYIMRSTGGYFNEYSKCDICGKYEDVNDLRNESFESDYCDICENCYEDLVYSERQETHYYPSDVFCCEKCDEYHLFDDESEIGGVCIHCFDDLPVCPYCQTVYENQGDLFVDESFETAYCTNCEEEYLAQKEGISE